MGSSTEHRASCQCISLNLELVVVHSDNHYVRQFSPRQLWPHFSSLLQAQHKVVVLALQVGFQSFLVVANCCESGLAIPIKNQLSIQRRIVPRLELVPIVVQSLHHPRLERRNESIKKLSNLLPTH